MVRDLQQQPASWKARQPGLKVHEAVSCTLQELPLRTAAHGNAMQSRACALSPPAEATSAEEVARLECPVCHAALKICHGACAACQCGLPGASTLASQCGRSAAQPAGGRAA